LKGYHNSEDVGQRLFPLLPSVWWQPSTIHTPHWSPGWHFSSFAAST